jgi:hypothetical protein
MSALCHKQTFALERNRTRLAHKDIMIAPHSGRDEVDDRANARDRLKVLMHDQPPISDEVDFRLHNPHEFLRLTSHEMGQHDQPAAVTRGVVLRGQAGTNEGRLWVRNEVGQPAHVWNCN